MKGHYPTVDDLKHCLAIDDKINCLFALNGDMLLVIGLTDTSYKNCLLLRSNCKWDPNLIGKNLRLDVLAKLTQNKGLEVNRKGGSSGCARVTDTFITFQNAGLLPRDASGVKFIQKKKEWEAFYVKPFDSSRSAASFTYGQPVEGGIVSEQYKLVAKHNVLQWFMLFKMKAPYILFDIDPRISPSAVNAQIAQNILTGPMSLNLLDQIIRVSKLSNMTYVQHPVGYHIDTFKNNSPVLENKICFVDESIKDQTGRGGAGRAKFVWALLDWS